MADLRIDSRMKVKTLKANFKKAFGATLRVYTTATCKAKADDEATLGQLMGNAKGGETLPLPVRSNQFIHAMVYPEITDYTIDL